VEDREESEEANDSEPKVINLPKGTVAREPYYRPSSDYYSAD